MVSFFDFDSFKQKYNELRELYYRKYVVEYASVMHDAPELIDNGMFVLFLEENIDNPETCNFFAKCMIDDIFESTDYVSKCSNKNVDSFEKYFLSYFSSSKAMEACNIEKFLIDFIMASDRGLGEYLEFHPDLLNDYVSRLKNISFKNFSDTSVIHSIISNFVYFNRDCSYSESDLYVFLRCGLGIELPNVCISDDYDFVFIDDDNADLNCLYRLIFTDCSEKEKEVLADFSKYILNYIKFGIIPDPYVDFNKYDKKV